MNTYELQKGDLVRAWLCQEDGVPVDDLGIKKFTLESGKYERSKGNGLTYVSHRGEEYLVQDRLVGKKEWMYKKWIAL